MTHLSSHVKRHVAQFGLVIMLLQPAGAVLAASATAVVVTPSAGTLTQGQVGTSYTQIFVANDGITGDSFVWSITGAVPDGLSLSTTTGTSTTLSGTPTTATTSNFSITAVSSTDSTTTVKNDYILTIGPMPAAPAISISPSTLPSGMVGAAYLQTLTASTSASGPFTWGISYGTLPVGLTLSTTTGATATISGTPTEPTTSTFVVSVTNGTSSTTQSYSIAVFAPVQNSTGNLIANGSFETANGSAPQAWSQGGFGTNAAVFTYPAVGIAGSKAAKIAISTYTSGDAKWLMAPVAISAGRTYAYTDSYESDAATQLVVEFTNSNNSVSYTNFTAIPASPDLSTWGTANVTFTAPAGVVSVRIFHILSGVGSVTLDNVSLIDSTPMPAIALSPSIIQNGAINVPYSQTITATTTATGPFTWSIDSGSLPVGYTLSASTGLSAIISGTSTATSTNTFAVKITNGTSSTTKQYSLTVFPSVVTTGTVTVITNVINDNGGTNVPADFDITASGASSTPAFFPGSSAGTNVSVVGNASYTITTNPGLFYKATYSPDCAGTLVGGDNTTCTITLDDLEALPVGQSYPNLIKNSSLETADPTRANQPQYWAPSTFGNNTNTFTYPVTGSTPGELKPGGVAANVTITAYTSGDAKWAFDNVAVIPGHTYTYTDAYISNIPSQLEVAYTLSNGTQSYANFVAVPVSPATSTWKVSSDTFTVPSGVVSVTVHHAIFGVGSLTIDNAVITEVPQPISFDQGFVSLTFDDGLKSHYTTALPILNAGNVKGSFYVVTHNTGFGVPNPQFEIADPASSTVPQGWLKSGSTNATFSYPVAGASGKAVQVSSSAAKSNAAWYFTPIAAFGDEDHMFADSYKSDTTSDVVIQMTTASGTFEYINPDGVTVTNKVAARTLASTSNTWVTMPALGFYVPPEVTQITILHQLTGIGTLAIDAVSFGAFTDYMTPQEVLALQTSGHEVSGHTLTHVDLSALPDDQAFAQINGSRQELLLGSITPASTFVYPYGGYTQATERLTKQAGYIAGRGVLPGFNGRNSDIYALLTESVNTDTTLAQVQAWIDQAKANKQWLILIFHPIKTNLAGEAYGTTPQILTGIVNYLNTNSVPVLTMAQGAALMGAPKLNVSVVVNNTHGATSTPADFMVSVAGASASPNLFQGSATSTLVSIQPLQQYSASLQSVPSNYTFATSTGCSGSQLQGTVTNCVITLNDLTVNHAPVAVNSATSTMKDTATPVQLSATDADGDALTYMVITAPAHGTLSGTTSTETYTPIAGFAGVDTFTFKANDGRLDSNIATVTVTISPGATSTSSNLILNPSFVTPNASNTNLPQNWSHGGWGTNTVAYTYPVQGQTDATAAKISISAYTDGDAKWAPDPVSVTPGHTYAYTDAYQSNVSSQLVIEYVSTANVYSYVYIGNVAPATGWTTASGSFVIPAGTATARVFHLVHAVGSLVIDDASLLDQTGGTVPPPAVTITPTTLPAGTVSAAYNQTLTANPASGTFAWSIASGSLPAGLSLGATTGNTVVISGTPTSAATSNFALKTTNGTSSTTQQYSIVINAAATASSTNLILNPSFVTPNASNTNLPQNWSHGGWGTNTVAYTYPVQGQTDATAAKISISAYTDGDAKWAPDPVSVTPGHTYAYTDAYQSDIGSKLVIEYKSANNAYTYVYVAVIPASTSIWGTASVTFTAPAGSVAARVFHLIEGVGSLTIDDASLVDQAGTQSTNLVANSAFEITKTSDPTQPQNWTPNDWGVNTNVFTYPVLGKSGNAAKVEVTSYTNGDAKWIMNPVTVTPGSSYTYSDTYISNVATQLIVQFLDASNNATYANYIDLPPSAGWGSSTDTFTVPTNTTSVRVFHYIATVGTLTIDDASLVKF